MKISRSTYNSMPGKRPPIFIVKHCNFLKTSLKGIFTGPQGNRRSNAWGNLRHYYNITTTLQIAKVVTLHFSNERTCHVKFTSTAT